MTPLKISKSPVEIGLTNFEMKGSAIQFQQRHLEEVASIYQDQEAVKKFPSQTVVYTVQSWQPVTDGTGGGLFFGTSSIMPGKVGREYFMTKGHFHAQSDRAEFYWGVQGKGVLILMDRDRNTWGEEVYPGSLHYIGKDIAHRLANTGGETLVVGACWPSDAGHDYEEIAVNGFSARLIEIDGHPVFVSE